MNHFLRLFSAPLQLKHKRITISSENITQYITIPKADKSHPYLLLPLFLLSLYLLFFLFTTPTLADNLQSGNFNIQMSTINITGGNKSNQSGTIHLGDTVGQTFQGQFDSAGFRIRAGFQYINTLIPFSFTISQLNLDFGELTPFSPKTAQNQLTISTGGAYGYSVQAIANHQMQTPNTPPSTIPKANCNSLLPCSLDSAQAWTDYDNFFGLGYNMSGTGVDTNDFLDSTYFKPFADNSLGETPVVVMSSTTATASATSTVTYQVNIDGTQAAGNYENAIQFIAVPSY